jgi:hypothetical protein
MAETVQEARGGLYLVEGAGLVGFGVGAAYSGLWRARRSGWRAKPWDTILDPLSDCLRLTKSCGDAVVVKTWYPSRSRYLPLAVNGPLGIIVGSALSLRPSPARISID